MIHLHTVNEIIDVLKGKDKQTALAFDKLAADLGLVPECKTGAKSYKIIYYKKKPKRVILTLEISDKKWRIKANVFHVCNYTDLLKDASEEMQSSMTRSRACIKCNPGKCKGGVKFMVNEQSFAVCTGSAFYFSQMSDNDYLALQRMIAAEVAY